jgi:hypothetical protein
MNNHEIVIKPLLSTAVILLWIFYNIFIAYLTLKQIFDIILQPYLNEKIYLPYRYCFIN